MRAACPVAPPPLGLRYCARPAFALERPSQVDADRVLYRLPKPQPDGRTALSLTPLELLDRLAALILPPTPTLPSSPKTPRASPSLNANRN